MLGLMSHHTPRPPRSKSDLSALPVPPMDPLYCLRAWARPDLGKGGGVSGGGIRSRGSGGPSEAAGVLVELGEPFVRRGDHDPLRGFTWLRLDGLVRAVLADWSDPGLSVMGLCRKHGLDVFQLRALSQLPAFRVGLAAERAAHEARFEAARVNALELARKVLGAEADAILARMEGRGKKKKKAKG
jgi:hypothetical protein